MVAYILFIPKTIESKVVIKNQSPRDLVNPILSIFKLYVSVYK